MYTVSNPVRAVFVFVSSREMAQKNIALMSGSFGRTESCRCHHRFLITSTKVWKLWKEERAVGIVSFIPTRDQAVRWHSTRYEQCQRHSRRSEHEIFLPSLLCHLPLDAHTIMDALLLVFDFYIGPRLRFWKRRHVSSYFLFWKDRADMVHHALLLVLKTWRQECRREKWGAGMSGFIPIERQASRHDRRQEDRHDHRDNVDLFGIIHRCSIWSSEKTTFLIA